VTFRQLVDLFKDNIAFKSTGCKPQVPVELQLAVFLARMAHGYMIAKLAHDFDIPSEPQNALGCADWVLIDS
jgi:hypothetical protein